MGTHGQHHHYFLATCAELKLGPVTGQELEYASGYDFRRVWVPLGELANIPVWPRCVAELLAQCGVQCRDVTWVEDDRGSWEGIEGEPPPSGLRFEARAVVTSGGRLAAIARENDRGRYFTLPGGGLDPGEGAEDAVVREALEELGLVVRPLASLAVVEYSRAGRRSVQTFFSCEVLGGIFGSGTGPEYSRERQAEQGSYRPTWLQLSSLPPNLRPFWLAQKLPVWLSPLPDRPERFCEVHDDD